MAGKPVAMSKINEIKRLRTLGLSNRSIARALKVSRNTISRYIEEEEKEYKAIVLPKEALKPSWTDDLDWEHLKGECFSRGVPLSVLWEELFEEGKIRVQYPGFWKQFTKRYPDLPVTMHRVFAPGERAEIDYCDGIEILDPVTGEILTTELFVGVLCHSRYVFAEFTLSQKSEDFLSSHVRMFEWFGGVPRSLAPDNLRSGVSKAHRYDPEINPGYSRLAAYYEVAVVPAGIRSPKHKAIAERTIQIFQRWFFYRVRNRTFTSLVELNACLKEHLKIFHLKKHRIFGRTRNEMFSQEKLFLNPLPTKPYEVSIYHKALLHPDCHVTFEKSYYSAPYQHRGKELDIWASQNCIEIYYQGERIAFHGRAKGNNIFVTNKDHYPPAQQAYLETTPSWIRKKAAVIGPNTEKVILKLLGIPYPLQYLRSAQGIVRLEQRYGKEKLESACQIALDFNQCRYRFIEGVLKSGNYKNVRAITTVKRGENPNLRTQDYYFNQNGE